MHACFLVVTKNGVKIIRDSSSKIADSVNQLAEFLVFLNLSVFRKPCKIESIVAVKSLFAVLYIVI